MNRPLWIDAPDWANYLGYNQTNRGWYWYENEPTAVTSSGGVEFLQYSGRKEFTGRYDDNIMIEKKSK